MKDYWIMPVVKITILVLILVNIQYIYCDIIDQIDKQFDDFTVIEPKLLHTRHRREIQSTKINSDGLEHIHGITLKFIDKGKEYIIDLSLNKELIPANYFEKYQKNGDFIINRPKANEVEFCNYNGQVRDSPSSWAAISTCDGIRGMFFDGISYYYIENVKNEIGDKDHILYKHDNFKTNHVCGFPNTPYEFIPNKTNQTKRKTRSLKGPYNQNDRSRFIELVLVIDQSLYKDSFNQELSKVYQYTKEISNIINSLFIPLNIFITLVGVVVWTEYDEINIVANGDATLTNFLHYRREHLVKDHPNDNAQLLTNLEFDNGIVGKALKGPICTYEFSGGVNRYHSTSRSLVATTIAHEIGHNLGMEHDTDDCDCPDERCVMAPSSGPISPTHWSSCSMEYLALAFAHGMDYCLINKPEKLFKSPICGNSFVEGEEECDCGLKEMCKNPCCNPETCMLYANATCATGQCCDLKTCHLMPAGSECRSTLNECDLPEYCSGESEYCPDNVFKIDGSTCEKNKAFCYEGSCRTHTDQCRLLWGPTGESSSIQCYKMNNKGTLQGNCGYNRLNKTYIKCNNENIHCGMLHCKHKNERLEFGMETVSTVSHTFINNAGSLIPCRSAIVDLGLNEVDPGLTPNGAKCGENMMCVNQKCMAVDDFRIKNKSCPNDCNGNGVCNNKGNCHCKIGYAPPYCEHPGPGGSENSGPASSPNVGKGFLVGILIVTLGAIPLMLAVLLFTYCSKNHSPTDWNKTNRKKLSNDAELGNKPNGTVSPSSSLLTNNQNPSILQSQLISNFKGFNIIKPLTANKEQLSTLRTPGRPAPVRPAPVRPAPSVPPMTIMFNQNSTKGERLQISQPVLDATTSSAVHDLVSVPIKPAPPVPTVTKPVSTTITADTKNSGNNDVVGGYPTLRRITSFIKNHKPEEKKPVTVRVNSKFDKEELKHLEISQPILQSEITMPSEPLPLEVDKHKAVVLRAQSLRTVNNTKHRPSVPNFGSMRSKRPTSVITVHSSGIKTVTATCSRPTSPPPQPPPLPSSLSLRSDYQIPRPSPNKHNNSVNSLHCDSNDEVHSENIYSVIDENPTMIVNNDEDDSAYKVPKSLESSLLGEIVSAIQERNHESIYTSKPTVPEDGSPKTQMQQTYENFNPSPSGSTTSSGYMRPVNLKSRPASNNRPDLVKNCDDNRSLNRSPDVLEAKVQPAIINKPTVIFPKPVIEMTTKPVNLTATVGLKKKLSDNRQSSKVVANIQKRFENSCDQSKNPMVPTKPIIAGNR